VRTCVGEKAIFAMQVRTFARAPFVSPPWFGFALATAIGFFQSEDVLHRTFDSRTTAGLRQPLLIAPTQVVADARFVQHERTFTRAAGGSMLWLGVTKDWSRAWIGGVHGVCCMACVRETLRIVWILCICKRHSFTSGVH
jgi:hypothetical protein